jgi:hypothetical protein
VSFGGKSQSQVDQRLNTIQLTQSSYGNCVPLLYGKSRIAGSLIHYLDFKAIPHSEKTGGGKGGGGGATHTSYSYQAAVAMMLCEGQITSVGTVWADKSQTTLAALGLTLFVGSGGPTVWSYLTTNAPTQAVPYDHTAYVANGAMDLGGSAALPNLSFEVKGLQVYASGTIDDAEPKAILTDYCTDAHHGCNFPYLDSSTLSLYSDYCVAMGFFLSPVEKGQRQAADFIKEMLKITNSDCVWSAGKLKVFPYADQAVTGNSRTYTPNLTPQFGFGDDDYCPDEGTEPVRVTRKAPGDTFNIVRVEYSDRTNQYNTAIAEAKDEQDIIVRGEKTMPTLKFPAITDKLVARQVAQLIMQRQLYVLNSYAFEVRPDYSLLEPMDYVSLTDSGLGIANKLVRITSIEDDEEDHLSFEAEEVLVGTASAPLYNWQAAQGYAANYNTAPGSVQTPFIFTGPPLLVDAAGGYEIWLAINGPSASSSWGGCNVYMSVDGGTRYEFVGRQLGGARYGTLTATLATGVDPDTTHTLAIAFNDTNKSLVSASTAEYNNLASLIYVDGEIMSYLNATLTGAGAYNLTSLRRGKYGSVIGAHLSGTRFVRLDGNILRIPIDPGMIGQTIKFKFASFNIYGGGLEDISTATAYSYTVANNSSLYRSSTATLVARNSCIASGNTISKSTTGAAAWDSDCYSIEAYSGGCALSWRVPSSAATLTLGLNSDPTTNQSWTSLDYAIETDAGGTYYWNQAGVFTSLGTFSAGDSFSLRYDGQWVRGYRNGAIVKEVFDPGKVFFMDSSFLTPGGIATEVAFGPLSSATPSAFLARGRCKVSDTNVICQGGSVGRDSDFYSIAGFPTCHITFKMNTPPAGTAPTTDPVIGLAVDPISNISYPGIAYAFDVGNYGGGGSKTWQILESGSAPGVTGSYTEATVFAITYDGSNVLYMVNETVVRTVAVAGLTLFAKGSFAYPGEGINSLRFGPTANISTIDTNQMNENSVTDPAVTLVPADGSLAYTSGTQPRLESAGLSSSVSYTAPGNSDAQVVASWSGQANISNTTSGTAPGEARIQVDVVVNGVNVFSKYLALESFTGAGWGSLAGTRSFDVPFGQTITMTIQTYRHFSSSGTSPAQTMNWRAALLNLTPAKR